MKYFMSKKNMFLTSLHVTACDLQKSFSFDKTVDSARHITLSGTRVNIVGNTCSISRDMVVRKVSNNRSDLQGH